MSTYEIRSERNYAPKVIRVRNLIELPGLDNLRWAWAVEKKFCREQ